MVESVTEVIKPRGTRVMLDHGGLPEVIPPYLRRLIAQTGGPDGPIGRQFVAQPDLENRYTADGQTDPLLEDHHEVAPGLVYKYRAGREGDWQYSGRALFTITRNCAAYCRFCTRGREVGIPGNIQSPLPGALSTTPHLSIDQIDKSLAFISQEEGLNEVIVSGGDPLTIKPDILDYVLEKLGGLQRDSRLDIVRIGTRLPIHNPISLKDHHYRAVKKLVNPRLMVHINHELELTPEAIEVLNRFRAETQAIIMSQTVFLRGVNDNPQTLYRLFSKVASQGYTPYYLFQNDPVYWAKHFTVPIDEAIAIWQQLRPRLSGVAATARFAIDVPNGYGKIPLPEGDAWDIDYSKGYRDFKGVPHSI